MNCPNPHFPSPPPPCMQSQMVRAPPSFPGSVLTPAPLFHTLSTIIPSVFHTFNFHLFTASFWETQVHPILKSNPLLILLPPLAIVSLSFPSETSFYSNFVPCVLPSFLFMPQLTASAKATSGLLVLQSETLFSSFWSSLLPSTLQTVWSLQLYSPGFSDINLSSFSLCLFVPSLISLWLLHLCLVLLFFWKSRPLRVKRYRPFSQRKRTFLPDKLFPV